MVRVVEISGYDGFKTAVENLSSENAKSKLNIYFTGSKNVQGSSWCPDCNDAEPYVMKALESYGENDSVFLIVDVGDRTFWKNMSNPFRKDSDTKLSVIPTLLRWQSPARLDGEQCQKPDLLEMFFTEN